MEYSIAI